MVIPYTIYDLRPNRAYVYLGTSKDTAEFVADCLRHRWFNYGNQLYPSASAVLILADGGGSNSSRHFIFKSELEKLAQELTLEIRMAHYPTYCSKWNPVEHRVFPLSHAVVLLYTRSPCYLKKNSPAEGKFLD